ncbi:MAG: hypothetical protein NZM31_13195 [Gemmatales bacterium]|nr:hypothetical protein [Gemmatales bacterium]MDW8387953.1 hypothetical protein [Gemmatales bacterium]
MSFRTALTAVPILSAALSVLAAQPADENLIASQNRARAILERAIKAHGGDIRVNRARNTHLKLNAKAIAPPDEESPFQLEIVMQLPDKYRSTLTTTVQNTPVVRTIIVNGDKGWMTVNGQGKELSAKELAEAKEQMYAEWVCRLITLRESDCVLREMDETKIENRPVQVVNVTRKGRRDVNLFFDKQTGLLVKMEHIVRDHQGLDSSQEVVFIGYRDTATGPKHWTRIIVFNDSKRIFEAELVEVRFPERLDDRLFQKPPEVTAAEKAKEKEKPGDKPPGKPEGK